MTKHCFVGLTLCFSRVLIAPGIKFTELPSEQFSSLNRHLISMMRTTGIILSYPTKTHTTSQAVQHVGLAGASYDMRAPRLIQICVQVVAQLLLGVGKSIPKKYLVSPFAQFEHINFVTLSSKYTLTSSCKRYISVPSEVTVSKFIIENSTLILKYF